MGQETIPYTHLPWEQLGLRPTHAQERVYHHIFTHSFTKRDNAWVLKPFKQRQETIAQKLGYHRGTVARAMAWLKAHGVITIQYFRRRTSAITLSRSLQRARLALYQAMRSVGLVKKLQDCKWKGKEQRAKAWRSVPVGAKLARPATGPIHRSTYKELAPLTPEDKGDGSGRNMLRALMSRLPGSGGPRV